MKISVITLHTVNNYGSVLQTYATKRIFEKMGHSVEFVDYWRKNNTLDYRINKIFDSQKLKKHSAIFKRFPLLKKFISIPLVFISRKRTKPTRGFIKKHVTLTRPYYSFDDLKANPPEADVYVTGSDQVWNSTWNEGLERPYYLDFAPEGKKRIAFATSIGKDKLDEDEIPEMKQLLEKYSAISMREISGVSLLKDMGINSTLILDPTLMLRQDEWVQIAKKIKTNKPLLVVYQLNVNPEMDRYIEKLSTEKNWNIVRLSYGTSDKKKKGKWVLMPSVDVFLGYLLAAECIVTDSFHFTSFALNLNKNFIAIPPSKFSTRIESILKLTGTESCMLTDYSDTNIANAIPDFEKVNLLLDKYRKNGWNWLEKALN